MAEKIVVTASERESRGKNEARRQRVTGNIPAVLYGGKGAAQTLTVSAKQVGQILRSPTGHNTLFQVALGGKEQPAIVKDWQVDPARIGIWGFSAGGHLVLATATSFGKRAVSCISRSSRVLPSGTVSVFPAQPVKSLK